MPFVKLDTGILDSSLWSEPSSTRICWITLLAMADATGLVKSTAPGIANRANLGVDETAKALEIFESPDQYSRSLNDQGKKIRRVDGGYQIINYQKYRDYDYTAAERMRKYRALRRNGRNNPNKTVTLRKQKQSTEADSTPPLSPSRGKPSMEEVQLFFGNGSQSAYEFWDYYESNGWKVGRNPMKDWKSAARRWQRNSTNGQRQTSVFDIERRIKHIGDEINKIYRANGNKRIEGDGIDDLKKRRDELQKQLVA